MSMRIKSLGRKELVLPILSLSYAHAMELRPQHLSAKGFSMYAGLVLLGLVIFPLYQALQTGGYLFYTTGMDEASHLSFSYAEYVANHSGRMRYSSHLVTLLHHIGISGGYINLLLDLTCALCTIILVKGVFVKFGYSKPQARCGAILLFLLPLLFTPFNPVVSLLSSLHFDPQIMRWVSIPWNPEIPLLRSPEPQVSWLLIAATLWITAGTTYAPLALLAISPLVYSFVQLPLIFVSAFFLFGEKARLPLRLLTSFGLCGVLMLAFLAYGTDPKLPKFFIFSSLPLIPFSGVLSLSLYLLIQDHVPPSSRPLLIALVCSTWAVANVQLVSGYLVPPVNFENYWGVMVLSFLATMGILHRSEDPRGWVGFSVLLFGAFSVATFAFNQSVSARLARPREVLPLLAKDSSRVACNDLYLTTYLDLVYPRQEPTTFSWTRTLDISSDANYQNYLCDKQSLQSFHSDVQSLFNHLFVVLDEGFISRGSDMFMSLGRQNIPTFTPQPSTMETECISRELWVVPTY